MIYTFPKLFMIELSHNIQQPFLPPISPVFLSLSPTLLSSPACLFDRHFLLFFSFFLSFFVFVLGHTRWCSVVTPGYTFKLLLACGEWGETIWDIRIKPRIILWQLCARQNALPLYYHSGPRCFLFHSLFHPLFCLNTVVGSIVIERY